MNDAASDPTLDEYRTAAQRALYLRFVTDVVVDRQAPVRIAPDGSSAEVALCDARGHEDEWLTVTREAALQERRTRPRFRIAAA